MFCIEFTVQLYTQDLIAAVHCIKTFLKPSQHAFSTSRTLLPVPLLLVAALPPFRPGKPALCGNRPLVTPYYCRLRDLLCFVFMSVYCMFDLSVYYLFLQYFDTVGWVCDL